MADEKLPEYVEEAIAEYAISAMRVERGSYGALEQSAADESALRLAISRYARAREVSALERAAQVCDELAEVMEQNHRASMNDEWGWFKGCYEKTAERIRALIHKEPANG